MSARRTGRGDRGRGLVGRAVELDRVREAVTAAGSPGAVLAGEAGVGKSALMAAVLDELVTDRSDDVAVVRIRATASLVRIPLGAVGEWLPPADVGPLDPAALIASVCRSMHAHADGRSLVVAIDDAHHLDPLSAAIVRRLADRAVTLLATVRARVPLLVEVTGLWSEAGCSRVELAPLGRDDTAALLEDLVHGSVGQDVESEVWRLSEGNPLFATELVRGGLESGALRIEHPGQLVLAGRLADSHRIVDTLGARLLALDEPGKDVVAALALVEPLPLEVVAHHISDLSAVESLERSGVVELGQDSAGGSVVRFAHPLFAELAAGSLRGYPTRRLRLTRPLADAMAPLAQADMGVQRAELLASSPDVGPGDVEVLTAAALTAQSRHDPLTAHRLAAAALSRSEEPALSLELLVAATESATRGDHRRFESLFRSAGTVGERSAITYAHVFDLLMSAGRPAEGLALLQSRRRLPDLQADQKLAGLHTTMLFFFEGAAEALAAADAAITSGLDLSDVTAVDVLMGAASAAVVLGMPEAAKRRTDDALRAWTQLPESIRISPQHSHAVDQLVFCDMVLRWQTGDMCDASEGLRRRFDQTGGAKPLEAVMLPGLAELYRGHLDAAEASFEGGYDLLELAPLNRRSFTYPMFAWLAALRGDAAGARMWLDVAAALPPAGAAFRWTTVRGWSLVAAAEQRLDEACRLAWSSAGEPTTGAWGRTVLLHDLVRHGQATDEVVDALTGMSRREHASWWDDACLAHAVATRHCDGDALDGVAAAFADGGLDLYAAEAAAQASRAHRDADQPAKAHRSAQCCRELLVAVGGARTPALGLLVEQADPLSPRERAVAELAVSGLSNKEIAAHLDVSVRTVGNQLQSVYTKLGVHGRSELTEVLGTA